MTYKRGPTWYVEFRDARGKRVRQATNAATKAQAERLEAELRVREERRVLGLEAHDRNPDKHTVRSLVEWHCEKLTETANGKSLGYVLKAHVTGDFAQIPIDKVTPADVRAWLDSKSRVKLATTGETPSSATLNRLRAYLSGAFSAARDTGLLIGDNPVRGTKQRKVEAPIPRALPAESVLPMLEHAPEGWRLVFALAAYAGLRRSEIERLKWSDVDLVLGVLYVGKTKAKKARVVPIHDDLLVMLKAAKAKGGAVVHLESFRKSAEAVRDALAAAGVEIAEGVDACFHSLRHTWASQWAACGTPPAVVEWVGWGPRAGSVMQTNYLQMPVGYLRTEMAKLTWPKAAEQAEVIDIQEARGA